MNDVQPLRGIFDQMVGDPTATSAPESLESFDASLLADALVAYADTAPVEVAAHLEPFVVAATTGQAPDPAEAWGLLGSATVEPTEDVVEVEPEVDGVPQASHEDVDFGLGVSGLDLGDIVGLQDPVDDLVSESAAASGSDAVAVETDAAQPDYEAAEDDWLTAAPLEDPDHEDVDDLDFGAG